MRLRNHFAATAELWPDASPQLWWYVTFDGGLDFLARWLEPLLDRPYLAPVPPERLHLTLGRAEGDPVELAAEAGRALAAAQPVDALVGPERVVDDGVAGDVIPAEEVTALRDLLPGVERGPLRPHVSFAYAVAESEMDEIEAVASDAVTIDTVSLVALRREARGYRWDVVAALSVGSAA